MIASYRTETDRAYGYIARIQAPVEMDFLLGTAQAGTIGATAAGLRCIRFVSITNRIGVIKKLARIQPRPRCQMGIEYVKKGKY